MYAIGHVFCLLLLAKVAKIRVLLLGFDTQNGSCFPPCANHGFEGTNSRVFFLIFVPGNKKAPKRRLLHFKIHFLFRRDYSSSAIKSLPKLMPNPRADFIKAVSRETRFGFCMASSNETLVI